MDELSFGQWLSRQRKSLGLTQKQLAERINCATITVRKIEAEQRHPSVQILEQLAHVLEIPANEFEDFLRFALGDGQSNQVYAMETHPWRVSAAPSNANLRPITISLQGYRHMSTSRDGLRQDSISDLYSLAGLPGDIKPSVAFEEHHGPTTNHKEGAYLLLMVPIKYINQTVLSIIESLENIVGSGESSLKESNTPLDLVEIAHQVHLNNL